MKNISKLVETAHSSFLKNSKSQQLRFGWLSKWNDLILQNKENLARLIHKETGKSYKEAMAEINYECSYIEWFAHESKRMNGMIIPGNLPNRKILVYKQPLGVCVLITPWNFPVAMLTRKIAPALACGNSCIIKPAPETPLCALELERLANEAGIPQGLIQVIPAEKENAIAVAEELILHKLVKKISITGSTQAGKKVMEKASFGLKRVTMELGGNAPFIVFPHFNSEESNSYISRTVNELINSKFRNSGQACISPNRIFLHSSIHDSFVSLLRDRISHLKTSNPSMDFKAEFDIGPLISLDAVKKVKRLVKDAVKKGALISCGETDFETNGKYVKPILLLNCDETMDIFHEEIFGPVIPVYKFTDTAEVIRRSNNSTSGLAGYVFSPCHSTIQKMINELEVGMVGVNEGSISTEMAPFGGIKESGFGREGSVLGLDDYCVTKYVCLGE